MGKASIPLMNVLVYVIIVFYSPYIGGSLIYAVAPDIVKIRTFLNLSEDYRIFIIVVGITILYIGLFLFFPADRDAANPIVFLRRLIFGSIAFRTRRFFYCCLCSTIFWCPKALGTRSRIPTRTMLI